jgi:hypothetical protein
LRDPYLQPQITNTNNINSYSKGIPQVYSGKYGPLFSSFSVAAFATFVRTTKMSRKDFTLLLKILQHPDFSVSDLPKSYAEARGALSNLPILPLHVRELPCNQQKGSGRSGKSLAQVYAYSVSDVLCRALSIPSLISQMYFGPGVKVHKPCEFWEGQLWMESCLFGVDQVIHNG